MPWTADNIPDLTGKVMIVTGANTGIGFESAKAFAHNGARTILACRNMEKAAAALADIQREVPDAPAEIMALDLSSLASVRAFAEAFTAKYDRLDVLLNNAGIMMTPYDTTGDGLEQQMGVNHFGHFALTAHLMDLILATPGARVVNVSSNGHRAGNMNFDNLLFEDGEGYSPIAAYGRSKLANLLFTYELQRRFEALGADAAALAAHPGGTNTDLGRYVENRNLFTSILTPVMMALMQDADMGALPSIRAAVDPDAEGGQYYGPRGLFEQGGYPVEVQSNAASHNEADARRLWELSEELTGVSMLSAEATPQ